MKSRAARLFLPLLGAALCWVLVATPAGQPQSPPGQSVGADRRNPAGARGKDNPYRRPVGRALRTTTVPGPRTGAMLATTAAPAASTLVLYDVSGEYGWLGELYGIMAANLVSHFGPWTAQPIQRYTAGQLENFTATVYVGSTYDEPIPTAFLDDVLATQRPITWIGFNVWQLTSRFQTRFPQNSFQAEYGWMWAGLDFSTVDGVLYKGERLNRYGLNNAGMMTYVPSSAPAVELASAVRQDGTTFPWAVRSRQLTYIGENPFVYVEEGDRGLIFEDLLFDALDPLRPERHRALVRLEDISTKHDPAQLRAVADYLQSEGVPFAFGVVPMYTDPLGEYNGGTAESRRLRSAAARPLVEALRYLQQKGGVMIGHGWTHQHAQVRNPYTAVTGDDFEFYRIIENSDLTLTWAGPLPGDTSKNFTKNRLASAAQEYALAGFPTPTIFEFPHYSASAFGYRAAADLFPTRYERSLYFRGLLSGGTVDHSRLAGQRFSYVVRDVYGSKVIPENLGAIEPEPFHQFPVRMPEAIIADARRVKVIRDGFASFYFHPYLDLGLLRQTIAGIKAQGYTFVSVGGL